MTYYAIKDAAGRYVSAVHGSSKWMNADWTNRAHRAMLWETEEEVRYAFTGLVNGLKNEEFDLSIMEWKVRETQAHNFTREKWDTISGARNGIDRGPSVLASTETTAHAKDSGQQSKPAGREFDSRLVQSEPVARWRYTRDLQTGYIMEIKVHGTWWAINPPVEAKVDVNACNTLVATVSDPDFGDLHGTGFMIGQAIEEVGNAVAATAAIIGDPDETLTPDGSELACKIARRLRAS